MPDLRDMTQLKRKREVEEETEKSESSLEEECKRFRSQYVSPQVAFIVVVVLVSVLLFVLVCSSTFIFVFILFFVFLTYNLYPQTYQSAMWGKWVQGQHANQAIKVKIRTHIRI